MTMNKYQRFCYDHFGRKAEEKTNEKLKKDLSSAHMNIRPAAYLSYAWFSTILVLVVGYVAISTLLVVLLAVGVELQFFFIILFLILPILLTGLTYGGLLAMPGSTAKGRKRKIDMHLPYALNFISAMSSAGITPTEIFKSLSKQDIYGEIKEEAAWIYRDVAVLGYIITAIRTNVERTPSQKFKEFLQGTVVTVTSGGSLKTYFMAKADQYMRENRQAQNQKLESLGIMAESYVTAAVAGILMLLVVIPLMMIVVMVSGQLSQSQFDTQIMFMYIVVFILLPIIHIGFAIVIRGMVAEG